MFFPSATAAGRPPLTKKREWRSAMGNRAGGRRTGPKCIAIVGPFSSGKTTLLEAILARTGAIPRQNPVASGNTVSDHSPEARTHAMSVEATFATTEFMGDSLTFVDCPGSIEFASRPSRCWPPATRPTWWPRPTRRRCRRCSSSCAGWTRSACRASCSSTGRQGRHRRARDAEDVQRPSSVPLLLRQIPLRKTASSSARSTWRWSAPTSTANMPRARWPRFPATTRRARSRRAFPCWRRGRP